MIEARLPPTLLVPADNNPNVMPQSDYGRLVAAIKKFGFLQPVLVRLEEGVKVTPEELEARVRLGEPLASVVDGAHRLRAAQEIGLTEIPCIVLEPGDTGFDSAEVLRVGMNRLRGELNLSEVGNILAELQQDGWTTEDLSLTGFSEGEINDLIDTATRDTDDDLSGMGNTPPPDDLDPPPPRPFLIEILFSSREEYQQARKGLRRAAGSGNELSVGLLRLLGEE